MKPKTNETGAIIVLVAAFFTLSMLMLAVAVEIGWMHASRAELQHGSDSAALAAVFELLGEEAETNAPNKAVQYAGLNKAAQASAQYVDPDSDVTIGYIDNPLDLSDPLQTEDIPYNNSVQVRTRMGDAANGGPISLDMFLGAFTGIDQLNIETQATATIDDRIVGFDSPSSWEEGGQSGSVGQSRIMPFTVRADWYRQFVDYPPGHEFTYGGSTQITTDEYRVNNGEPIIVSSEDITLDVSPGTDGKAEMRLYPYFFQNEPANPNGNFGTLSIPPANNSTQVRREQIANGVTDEQYDETFGDDGIFYGTTVEGDPGLSEAMLTEFESIIGEVRYLILHTNYEPGESGSNALFYIDSIVAVVIVDVITINGGGGGGGGSKPKGQEEQLPGNRYILVQPLHGIDIGSGRDVVVDYTAQFGANAPHSGGIYTYALTR